MCFDTTSSNTGHVTAACVTIQQQLGRALLWCACRHHVGEVVISHVFEKLEIEVSKSQGIKCPRCWKILDNECERCERVIKDTI